MTDHERILKLRTEATKLNIRLLAVSMPLEDQGLIDPTKIVEMLGIDVVTSPVDKHVYYRMLEAKNV